MISALNKKIIELGAPVCVGLDPALSNIPPHLLLASISKYGQTKEAAADAIWQFNRNIIDAVADLIPAVKPQIAMYEQFGSVGIAAYEKTLEYCKKKGLIIIADVKRGDIGSTSESYAAAHLGKTMVGNTPVCAFDCDFATVNPYLGSDCIEPFLKECRQHGRGIFVLVKTSNPSSGEFQDKRCDGVPVYELVARKVDSWGALLMDGDYSDVGAVVGATYPRTALALRDIMPRSCILVPGYGAQGAVAHDLKPFFNKDGLGAIVNSSRGIIAAWKRDEYSGFGERNFADAARAATEAMIKDLKCVAG